MRRKRPLWGLLSFVLFLAYTGCKKPYAPPAIIEPAGYLVVEGIINSGADSTIIKLSRTVNISSVNTSTPLTGANVSVKSDQNVSYPLQEISVGRYVALGLNLDNSHKYQLDVKASNDEYQSDFEAVLNSPPIDSVSFTIAANGINIFSNTHDPQNQVKYYRWDFGETWIIHSNYYSAFYSNGDTVLARPADQQIYTCWSRDTSSVIILNSSAKLSRSEIVNNPLTSVSSTSLKLGTEYSILVRQYALSADAYVFWTNLKKNTEQLGGIFDPQPSQINGNIHSVNNPNEAVIGYISVGSTSTARIFIQNRQLPAWLPTPAYPDCQLDAYLYKYIAPGTTQVENQIDEYINYDKGAVSPETPVNAISLPNGPIIGYTAADPECVDCTLRGTNKEPVFWK